MMSDFIPYKEASKILSKREKVGQSFMPAAFINDSEDEIRELERTISNFGVGGLCFFHSRASAAANFEGPREVIYNENSLETLKKLIDRYQKASKYPLLISIDAEWGLAMRIENSPQYPYAITLGAMEEQEAKIFEVGQRIGRDCREAGIHWNFAPVVDINNNPDNPVIGYRSFGEIPWKVARYARAFSAGLNSSGILSCAKHFPGHGDTATDSHLGLPLIDKSLEELFSNELQPFIKLIKRGTDAIMVGHLAVPTLSSGKTEPASVSKEIIEGFLRMELGFNGVVVSDALNMHSVSRIFEKKGELEQAAYAAGTDILCYCEYVEDGINMISEKTSETEIETHFKRVWQLKEKAFQKFNQISSPDTETHAALMQKIALESLCIIKGSPWPDEQLSEVGFKIVVVKPAGKSAFAEEISRKYNAEVLFSADISLREIQQAVAGVQQLILAVYPPSAKPTNDFGLGTDDLELIEWLACNKQLTLYLFGNPYVLNLLTLARYDTICVAFQDFEEFEINAAMHFKGEVQALGKLPVSINTTSR